MALSNVELYEALKPTVGEEAARLMANVIPPAENLATRLDVSEAKADVKAAIAKTNDRISRVETKMEANTKDLMRWMLVLFVPVWAGTWGTIVAVLLKH